MVDGYGGNYWVYNLGRVLSTKVNKQGKEALNESSEQ